MKVIFSDSGALISGSYFGRALNSSNRLATPFRYPPLAHGSRFGGRRTPSLWYGSETLATVLAEVAYYRLVFLDGTTADLGAVTAHLTAFHVKAMSVRSVDLTNPPFDIKRPSIPRKARGGLSSITSPSHYEATQALGDAMRQAGVELFRFPSARDADGVNVGVFKRPDHALNHADYMQAIDYRHKLSKHMGDALIQVVLIGGRRSPNFPSDNREPMVEVRLFSQVIATARRQTEWLLCVKD
jgi:hypothetical protein